MGSSLITPFARPDPSGQSGILDAALLGEGRTAQAAGLESGENLALEFGSVAGAPGLIGFDDDAGGLVDVGFHRAGILHPGRRRGIVGFC